MIYDYKSGKTNVEEILNNSTKIQEKEIPSDETDFTYGNGVRSWVGSIFIDIIDSTSLIKNYNELVVAKVLRSFTSEAISILNSHKSVRQIGVRGDCVYGIYSTPNKKDIYDLFDLTCYLNDMIKMLNAIFKYYKYPNIKVGIGLSVGRDLIIKAGKKGTGINDRIWIGDAVVEACKLANKAGRDGRKTIGISKLAYNNFIKLLKDSNKNNVESWFHYDYYDNSYYCDVIMDDFDSWIKNELHN